MKKLVIRNIGPITDVVLDLKRINVIIGPQSMGKSCILKIACFCAWAEKRIQLEQGRNGFADASYLEEKLISFHKMEGFVRPGAYFEYKTSYVKFSYNFDTKKFNFDWGHKHWDYKRSRISYIPAERNVIASVPNWLEVNMGRNNVRNFISDWGLTRQYYDDAQKLPILNLGVNYYFDKKSGKDYIELENGKTMDLTNGSSGLQSIIPMWVYLDFLFHKQYSEKLFTTLSTDGENEEILQHIYINKYKKGLTKRIGEHQNIIAKIGMSKLMFASEEEARDCRNLFEAYTKTWSSEIYLEEPEQNLFPLTQVELVNELLKNATEHKDSLFIATHSPYILYALNNNMLGYLVRDKIPVPDAQARRNSESWVNPKEVAVWEIKDGILHSTIDTKTCTLQDESGLIRGNYFDSVMKLVMTDFVNYSAYYG